MRAQRPYSWLCYYSHMTTQVVCSHDIACLCKIKSNRITDNMNLLSLWVTHQRDVIKHFRTSECRDGHWTLTEQNVARARVYVCVCVCACVCVLCVCVRVCCVCVCVVCVCVCVCVWCVCVYVWCVCVVWCVCMCACVCAWMHACMHMHACTCVTSPLPSQLTHTHTHTGRLFVILCVYTEVVFLCYVYVLK